MKNSSLVPSQVNAQPRADPPRRVPIALREPLEKELQNMVDQGIIEKVQEPAEWINSIVIVKRKNNKLRICIDPRYLNKFIIRQHTQLPTIDDIVDNLSGAKYFSKLDCNSGFWSVQLDSQSSKLCTFSTPYGNYRYVRLPFGLCISTEAFQERMEDTFKDIPGVKFYVDDLIIYAKTEEEHHNILLKVLKRAKECNVKFNKNKSEIFKTELKFLGMIVSSMGVKPDPEKIRAVSEIESIKNKKELERFLGMTNYLSKFIQNYSSLTAPIRELLKKDCIFQWNLAHEKAFNDLKSALTNSPVLKIYDINKDIVMSVDCSCEGVGACLLQEGKPVAYASKALSDCQKEYAQVEREMFAIVFGCNKFHKYIIGKRVTVESDHSALETLFKKPLCKVPSRIQRMMLKVQGYDLIVKYVPGNKMYISDFLSRSYLPSLFPEYDQKFDEELNTEIIGHVAATIDYLPISENKKELIKTKCNEDPVMIQLKYYIHNGWPESKQQINISVTPFWNIRHDLSVIDNLIFKNNLIIIPKSLQKIMLSILHEGHFGYNTCWRRAKTIMFWPGIQSQIKEMCYGCQVCATFRPNNCKEEILFHDIPKLPWIKLGTDLFEFNKCHYILVVDYYSKYIEIAKLDNLTSSCIIKHLKSIMARHGLPLELISDNASYYSSEEFKRFSIEYGFKHHTSSPNYPKANGLAESSVKIIKNILKKCYYEKSDPYLALLNLRNSPKEGSPSPANLLFNRNMNNKCPVSSLYLQPKICKRNIEIDHFRQEKIRQYYNHTAKNLEELNPGQDIMFKKNVDDKTWTPGKILCKTEYPRSYEIRSGGKIYRRNRQHINSMYNNNNNSVDIYDNCETYNNTDKCETNTDEIANTNSNSDQPESYQQSHPLPSTLQNQTPESDFIRTMDNYVTRSGRTIRNPIKLKE